MARSRPTSPSKAACASAQSGIASATFPNPDGHSVTSKARPLSERSATTQPEAWSGFGARTKLVRSMISISANSVILSRPCSFSNLRMRIAKPDRSAGGKWLSYSRLRWRVLFRAAGRNRDRICLVSPPSRYRCAIAHRQEDLCCYNIVGPPSRLDTDVLNGCSRVTSPAPGRLHMPHQPQRNARACTFRGNLERQRK
jgi:hypothetical protein